ncbi:MAG: hypothetical protein ABIG89_01150 [Candidatus Woesearchaeota archaeon]
MVKTLYVVDVLDTLVCTFTPGFGPKTINLDDLVDIGTELFGKSVQAQEAFYERHNARTYKEILDAELRGILSGIIHDYNEAKENEVEVKDESALYVLRIKGAEEALLDMLRQDDAVVAIVSTSHVDQSRVLVQMFMSMGDFRTYSQEGKLRFINAAYPDGKDAALDAVLDAALSKKTERCWEACYRSAGFNTANASDIKKIEIYEDKDKNLRAAIGAAIKMFINAEVIGYIRISDYRISS